MRTRICDQFGIEFPIFAFSHCRDVVAAVSRAGGMGVLGALAYTPEELEIELRWIDEHVDGKPYGVDVVIPASYAGAELDQLEKMIPDAHRKFVEDTLDRYGVPDLPEGAPRPHRLLGWSRENARPQVDVALEHPIRLLANALGSPPADVIEKAHGHGVAVAALVGTAEHARRHVEAGVDIIVAQGYEAGGHTGEIASMVLIPEVIDAVKPHPVLAAGGIGNGRQMAAAMALGADGVWTGSIWLTVREADTGEALIEKLIAAGSRDTVRSRSMTGKPARQLRTPWTEAWEAPDSPGTLPMPLQFMLTADATARMRRYADDPDSGARQLVTSPVGQIVGSMNSVRAARDVVLSMVEEYIDTVQHMSGELARAGGEDAAPAATHAEA
jgi:NAD(P)H-dependent flavin oxidoreductase YrpB (nitropropane dioxygenase family)